MSRLDDIKRKLNLDNLPESERKKLFKEFVEHGGDPNYIEKEEKIVRRSKYQDIQRQTKSKNLGQGTGGSYTQTSTIKKEVSKESKKISREELIKSLRPSFLEGFYIKLLSFFNKVTNLSGYFLNINFINITTTSLLEAVNDLETTAKIILSSKSFNEFEIKEYFFKKFPIYYEVLIRLSRMNVKEIIQSISEKEKTSPSFKLPLSDVEKEIFNLLKTIYIFWPFKSSIPEAYREAFRILEKKENLPSNIVNTYITKIRRAIDFIFSKYLLKVYYAFLLSQNINIKISDSNMSILLQLAAKDKIGGMQDDIEQQLNREKEDMKINEEIKEEKSGEIINIEESLNLPKEVLNGLEIIESISLSSFGDSKSSPFHFYDRKDKIYHIAAIMDFFEKEYSFLITGNKISYYPEHHEGVRFDPKRDLNECYVELNSVLDSIREYSNIIKSISETEENSNIPVMQKHSLIHKASIERSKLSMSIRAKLSNVILKIKNTLEKIRTNYNKFVADTDKELSFSSGVEKSKKRLEGKKVAEALEDLYYFITGFHYLLTKGKLGGAGNLVRSDN